jgi:ABC-type dipeptide/oligopeptide/nickel transport system ATPase component
MAIMLITHAMGVVAEVAQRRRDVCRHGGRATSSRCSRIRATYTQA